MPPTVRISPLGRTSELGYQRGHSMSGGGVVSQPFVADENTRVALRPSTSNTRSRPFNSWMSPNFEPPAATTRPPGRVTRLAQKRSLPPGPLGRFGSITVNVPSALGTSVRLSAFSGSATGNGMGSMSSWIPDQ